MVTIGTDTLEMVCTDTIKNVYKLAMCMKLYKYHRNLNVYDKYTINSSVSWLYFCSAIRLTRIEWNVRMDSVDVAGLIQRLKTAGTLGDDIDMQLYQTLPEAQVYNRDDFQSLTPGSDTAAAGKSEVLTFDAKLPTKSSRSEVLVCYDWTLNAIVNYPPQYRLLRNFRNNSIASMKSWVSEFYAD